MPIGFHRAAVLVLAAFMEAGAAAAAPDPLAPYLWTARLLVLSAPDASDPRLADQRASVAAARAGFAERDLVVVEAVGGGARAVALRQRLGLPPDAFRVMLVGKDGGPKLTAPEPIPASRLFPTIDAMPMRRDEMVRGR